MKPTRRWPLGVLSVFFLAGLTTCASLNSYQTEGNLVLPGLKEPVRVMRDEKGMAYIYARDILDGILALGFVTAQDRLFQMELTKLVSTGRISELAGSGGEKLDTRMRTLGFHRQAKRHGMILDPRTRSYFQRYIDGVNAYIQVFSGEHHLEFKLSGIRPQPWEISDSLAILYFMSWNSAANIQTEILTQMLIEKVGIGKAREIFPLNIHPEEPGHRKESAPSRASEGIPLRLASDASLLSYLKDGGLAFGSNNWAVGSPSSPGGKPIVSNDPHLDARILPGPWYPVALITPEFRFVGVGIPGVPGLVIGRNEHIAVGVTNSYGDAQDLYVETVDPKDPLRYMEGDRSIPFEVVEETLTIKDKDAPGGKRTKTIQIRLTRRGPVISSVLPGLKTDRVITVRWSPFETMSPSLGFDRLMSARSVRDIREALSQWTLIMLNFVFADRDGNIGWIASGKLPIRSQGDGTVPFPVKDDRDNWTGWIPFEEMPQRINPQRGWVGTCNHYTVGKDYPYYYSSYASPSYRYRRLVQLLDRPGMKSAEDHWQFQRDTMNLMARDIAPIMARALMADKETQEMGEVLSLWDFLDDPDKAAPSIFQAIYREFALLVFEDELGEELARTMLDVWYFWQERLHRMVMENRSPWFDNQKTTHRRETRDDLFRQAAKKAMERWAPILGKNPREWIWGKVHRLEFVSPIRRQGFGKGLIGGGSHPFPGSGETLCRGIFEFHAPFDVSHCASLRMVADLSDDEKVIAVLPGGVTGRVFHPHTRDQIEAFLKGDKLYWWFSDRAIQAHSQTTLLLTPR